MSLEQLEENPCHSLAVALEHDLEPTFALEVDPFRAVEAEPMVSEVAALCHHCYSWRFCRVVVTAVHSVALALEVAEAGPLVRLLPHPQSRFALAALVLLGRVLVEAQEREPANATLAAWVATSRIVLNLDEFITRE